MLDAGINEGILGATYAAAYSALGVTPPAGPLAVFWLAFGLGVGLAIAWVSRLSIARSADGFAGVKAAAVVWAVVHGPLFAEAIAGIMPFGLVAAASGLELVSWCLAGWLAAKLLSAKPSRSEPRHSELTLT